MDVTWTARNNCRICSGDRFLSVFDFGQSPLADKLRTRPNSDAPAPRVPLALTYCEECALSQLTVDVASEYLYDADYPYFSSVSPALSRHFGDSARQIIETRGIGRGSIVIEAASNDGYMLQHFKAAGATAIGFDPAVGPARAAQKRGITTHMTFFGEEPALAMANEGVRADVFLANNVLAHVPDLTGFVSGIAQVLKPGGVAVIEVPYFVELVENREFDTIYHQHLCYFLVSSLARLFRDHGLCIA
ncbi:MAG: methyltransferase domain-containing protein, partial [Alphaproteobacteria bacterium]